MSGNAHPKNIFRGSVEPALVSDARLRPRRATIRRGRETTNDHHGFSACRSRRAWRLYGVAIVTVLAVGLLASGLRYGYWVFFEHRAAEISKGRLFQSAEMSAKDLTTFVEEHGIRAVFDLRSHDEGELKPDAERSVLEDLGVKYFNAEGDPLDDRGYLDDFLVAAADSANLPMLVHCHHGTGRSVLAAAVYRIEMEGWSVERARKATKLLSFRGTFGPRGPKGQFLRGYTPHLTGLMTRQRSVKTQAGIARD